MKYDLNHINKIIREFENLSAGFPKILNQKGNFSNKEKIFIRKLV